MARYIDADAFLEKMKKTNRYFDVKYDIEDMPTADVVPKSEVERLEEKCAILNEKNAQLALALFRDFPTTKELEVWEACEAVKTKVAREIFKEIEQTCVDTFGNFYIGATRGPFAELKKKYTEEKNDG